MMDLFQEPLFESSMAATTSLNKTHDLVKITKIIDWDALIFLVMEIRESKIKFNTDPEAHYRALLCDPTGLMNQHMNLAKKTI